MNDKINKAGFILFYKQTVLTLTYIDSTSQRMEYDFPKGKKGENESNLECAIRELNEELTIGSDLIIIPDFQDICRYCFEDRRVELTLFLGLLKNMISKHGEEHNGIKYLNYPEETKRLLRTERYQSVVNAYSFLKQERGKKDA